MQAKKTIAALIAAAILSFAPLFSLPALAAGTGASLSANYLTVPGGENVSRIMVENQDVKEHHFKLSFL
jgi:hypothetical protein